MTKLITQVVFAYLLLLAWACKNDPNKETIRASSLEYAKGFTLKSDGPFTEVTIQEPYPNARASLTYLLVPRTKEVPPHSEQVQVVRTPIEKIVCTSTSHIALLDQLGEIDKLVGFPSTELVSSRAARQRIDSGLVTDLGIDSEINTELLVALQPDVVMGYLIAGDMLKLDKIRQLGVPVVVNGEYLEDHPLGRAEWIKFMALFFGKSTVADSIFTTVKNDYHSSQALVSGVTIKPTVISGILYGDTWFLPGGQNYAAKIFRDAGYQYLWDSDPSNGFLKLSFESVYAIGKDADYWIGVGSFGSKKEMQTSEGRYTLFRAFGADAVYTYDAKKGPTGGSEYFELGYSRPDILLKDLIKISHPELLPEHDLYFYEKLD